MSSLGVVRRGHAALVTIERPDRRNALDSATVGELGRVGRELVADPELRAVVLTGAGERAFCAGADLKEREGMTDEAVRAMLDAYRSELAWLGNAPFPVVAALNGAALGGGLELALTCDLRVAAPHAVLGLPETSLGVIPGAGGTQRLPRLVGYARALELILLGTRLDADRALSLGLVNRVSPAGTHVVEDALAWLAPVLDGSPIAMRAALTAVRAATRLSLDAGLDAERQAYEACLASEDRREALRAFAEKRKPAFRGR
ncbi:MAG TPA: enoyl-CoA hydratase-related protein [Polyangiaceae bacterium]|nr:enoyl-CoA hydratase-related protein [Polyangiaceae bacterium]